VFLSYINDIPGRVGNVEALLYAAHKGELQIVTSTVSVVEVAYAEKEKSGQALEPAKLQAIDDLMHARGVALVEFYGQIAQLARAIVRESMTDASRKTVKPMDAIHVATALRLGIPAFYTYDVPLRTQSAPLGIPMMEPVAQQPMLGPPED
jgi:predicted nucleic acid-binding protein